MSRKSSPIDALRKKAFCKKNFIFCLTAEVAQPVISLPDKFWDQEEGFVFALSSVNEVVWLESQLA